MLKCIGFFRQKSEQFMLIFKKYRYFLVLGLFIISFCLGRSVSALAKNHKTKTSAPTIVIDPGHGGVDPGKISASGIEEKDINLSIALTLKKLFENRGYNVVMTRTTDCDLASENSKHPKTEDLSKRVDLMSQDDVVVSVSIHQNSFSDTSSSGPQVFYHTSSDKGKMLADSVLSTLNTSLSIENPRQIKPNNEYYILKNSTSPVIIVECGFLSNPDEADQLNDNMYQQKLARAIYFGVTDYLDQADPKRLQ